MLLAILKDNRVIKIVDVKDGKEAEHYANKHESVVDITNFAIKPQVGWLLDGNKLVLKLPKSLKLTSDALKKRLRPSELKGLEDEAKKNLSVGILKDWLDVSTYIDIGSQEFKDRIKYIASLGLITNTRLEEILNAPVKDYELFRG